MNPKIENISELLRQTLAEELKIPESLILDDMPLIDLNVFNNDIDEFDITTALTEFEVSLKTKFGCAANLTDEYDDAYRWENLSFNELAQKYHNYINVDKRFESYLTLN